MADQRSGKANYVLQAIDEQLAKGTPVMVVEANGRTVTHYPDGKVVINAEPLEPALELNVPKLDKVRALGLAGFEALGMEIPGFFRSAAKPRKRPVAGTPLPYNPRNEAKAVKGPDRNRPCPCGSGRKAKKCCGGAAIPAQRVLPKEMVYEEAGPAPTAEDYNKGSYNEFVDEVVKINGGREIRKWHMEFVAGCWGGMTPMQCWVAMRKKDGLNTCCLSCHYPADTACRKFHVGGNGRCVYCDHEQKCHPGPGATCDIGKEMVAGIDFAYDSELSIMEQEHLRQIYRKHSVSRGDDTQIRPSLGDAANHVGNIGAPSSAAEAVEYYEDEGGDAVERWEGEGGSTNEVSNGCANPDQSTDGQPLQVEDGHRD